MARDAFQLDLTVTTPVEEESFASFDSIDDAFNALDLDNLSDISEAYTETSVATAVLDVRGLPTIAAFEDAGTDLRFTVPAIGFERVFTGATRDDSVDALRDFLERNGDGLLTDILRALVATTPVDPVAGNPNSLMARVGAMNFGQGTELGGRGSFEDGPEPAGNSFRIGARFGRYSAGDFTQESYSLPLGYTYRFADPRYQLKLDLPITFINTSGARTLEGSFGVAVRLPVLEGWTLTPGLRIGGVGSIDLASAALVPSGSITSNYNFRLADLKITIGNGFSYFQTESISVDDYETEYDLRNYMIKNGIGVEGDTGIMLFGERLTWSATAAHTQFFGDELFIDSYVDLAAAVGIDAIDGWNDLQVGVTYQRAIGEDYNAFMANVGYEF